MAPFVRMLTAVRSVPKSVRLLAVPCSVPPLKLTVALLPVPLLVPCHLDIRLAVAKVPPLRLMTPAELVVFVPVPPK